jgi:hypothetical protein
MRSLIDGLFPCVFYSNELNHDLLPIRSVCASTHPVVALATDPYKSIGLVASFRASYSRACPRSWIAAKQSDLGAGSSARALRIIACGVIFALAAPFFLFWSEAALPCALALLVLRVSLPEGAVLNAGFIALMSYTGLHAVIVIVKRYNLQF